MVFNLVPDSSIVPCRDVPSSYTLLQLFITFQMFIFKWHMQIQEFSYCCAPYNQFIVFINYLEVLWLFFKRHLFIFTSTFDLWSHATLPLATSHHLSIQSDYLLLPTGPINKTPHVVNVVSFLITWNYILLLAGFNIWIPYAVKVISILILCNYVWFFSLQSY